MEAINVAYMHHERPDGKGYPNGLYAKDLSLFTKIIAIVDTYDAITNDRVYAKGRPSTEALRIIYEQRGRQFDEQLAMAFIQTIGIYPPGMLVELISGEVGIVVDATSGPKHLPQILVVLDENKQPCKEISVNLALTVDAEDSRGARIKSALPDGSYGLRMKDYFDRGVFEDLLLD